MNDNNASDVLLEFWSLTAWQQAALLPERFSPIRYVSDSGAGEVFTRRPYVFLACLARDLFWIRAQSNDEEGRLSYLGLCALFEVLIENFRAYPSLADSTSSTNADAGELASLWGAVRVLALHQVDAAPMAKTQVLSLDVLAQRYSEPIDERNYEGFIF